MDLVFFCHLSFVFLHTGHWKKLQYVQTWYLRKLKSNVNRQTKIKDKCWGTKELVSMHLDVADVITIQLTNARRPFWNPTTIFPYLGIMQLHTGCAVTASIPGICLEPLRCPVEDSQMWTVPPSVTVITVCCGEYTAACNGNPGTPGEKHRTGSPDSIFHPQTWRKTEVVVKLVWLSNAFNA